jgi:hypothetical protein
LEKSEVGEKSVDRFVIIEIPHSSGGIADALFKEIQGEGESL